MEQNMMVNHPSGRNFRPRGFSIQKSLQVALFFAVSIWLLYRIKHSDDNDKSFGGNAQEKFSKEGGTVALGRKGNMGFVVEAVVDFEDGNALGEDERVEDVGVGDDEFDWNVEEKVDEMKAGRQGMEIVSNGIEERESAKNSTVESHSKALEGDETELETKGKEPMNTKEDNPNTQVGEEEEEKFSFDEEEYVDSERSEKNALQTSVAESTDNPGQDDMGHGVHGFRDETGVPPDGLDLLSSSPFEPRGDDLENSMHHEILPSSNDQSSFNENAIFSNEEFEDSSEASGRNDTGNTILRREQVESPEPINVYDVELRARAIAI
ncbi:hypothetical protein L1049_003990 [Liquidambar formosana]|uniref:Uncharacterized protein n=1 Tax=Liquidambar formosana TaxID=63359 RepID=A0AAP0RMN0_LIQFO